MNNEKQQIQKELADWAGKVVKKYDRVAEVENSITPTGEPVWAAKPSSTSM